MSGRRHWGSIPLPKILLPRTEAHKEVVDGGYQFSVAISVPFIGKVLGYSGKLALSDGCHD